jgi:DNA-binding XRE family transcriptional regulator
MSEQDLANLAGVTRQTISGIESGQYAPSVAVSLRLAKALGCQVENLFWFEEDLPETEAIVTKPIATKEGLRVSLARVGDQWIAYPLVGNDAFRLEMIPADGEVQSQTGTNKVRVQLLDDMEKLHNTVAITGCTPVISLWAKATERWHPQLRVHYNFANSMAALHSLK